MKQLALILFTVLFSLSLSAQTYDLLGPEEPFTTLSTKNILRSQQGTLNMKIPALNMEMDGKLNVMDGDYKDILTIISDTEVKIKFEEYSALFEFEMNGDVSKDKQKMPIEGKEATFVKVREKWALKNPKKFKAKDLNELNYMAQNIPNYLTSLETIFPKNVKIGDTWSAKDEELIPIIGISNNIVGTATLTLISVDEKDDDTIATIGVVTKYTYDDEEGSNAMELEGTIKRSIKNYNFFKLETVGTFEMATETEESGMKMNILIKGDCESNIDRVYK